MGMIRRWLVYLAALLGGLGWYAAAPGWVSWMAVLTVAASPLVSVAISGGEDALGLFRLPGKQQSEYDLLLRPYRPGDALSRVHWKLSARSGLLLRQEKIWQQQAKKKPWFVPVMVSFAILFCIFPPWRFDGQLRFLQGTKTQVRLDLAVGTREESRQAVMDVVASESQRLYLRGQSYDVYDGQSWWATTQSEGWSVQGEIAGTVHIAARSGQKMNTAQQERPRDCLQLPKETKAWAKGILAKNGETVAQIQTFVRTCAQYAEEVDTVPENRDFVSWFAEESGRGYCVHFASTAVVLLRAAGIPARLATGYAVDVAAGLRKTVTGADAHAWAEYWDGEMWRILEATPTAAAVPVQDEKEESCRLGGSWVLILLALAAQEWSLRKYRNWSEDPKIKELKLKAAFSRDGLSEAEREEYIMRIKTRPCLPP